MAVFVRRRGRFTRGQKRAYDTLSGRYAITGPYRPPAGRSFGLEIGFGMGEGLVRWAGEQPDWQLLGVDVYQPGIGATYARLDAAGLTNVAIVEADASWLVAEGLPPACVSECRILFPDPWPKSRHAKRRLVQPAFAGNLVRVLAPGGVLKVATDWQPYAEWMIEVLEGADLLENMAGPGGYQHRPEDGPDARPNDRPETRFESRGRRLGHDVWDLRFQRRAD